MFANIRSLNKNKCLSIEADYGYMSCDIIMLSECHTKVPECHNSYKIPGYKMICATGNSRPLTSYGQVCYWRESSRNKGNLTLIAHNADQRTLQYNDEYNKHIHDRNNPFEKEMVEICMFKYTDIKTQRETYLVQIYNHPDSDSTNPENDRTLNNLISALKDFFTKNLRTLFIPIVMFGDFNVDFNDMKKREYWDKNFAENYVLKPTLENTCTRPRPLEKDDLTKQRQLDWVFTNKDNTDISTAPYSTYFSDHLPLYTSFWKF